MKKLATHSRDIALGLAVVLGLLFSSPAQSQITQPTGWTQQYANTAYPAGTVGPALTIAAGTNRLLLVAIASRTSSAAAQTVTVTYGGQTMLLAQGDGAAGNQQHTYFYYLNDAGITAATTTNLDVTITGGAAYYTWVYAAVFAGVNQATPFTNTQGFTTNSTAGTSVGPFALLGLSMNANDWPIEVILLQRSATGGTARTIATWAANWGTNAGASIPVDVQYADNSFFPHLYITHRAIPTLNTTDTSQHTASNNEYSSMSGISLSTAPAGPPTTTIGNGTVPASSTLCPNGALTDLDAFTLATNTGTDSVTALTVTLSPTGSFNNVGTIAITNNAGTTTYWTGAPTGDATAITLTTAIPVTSTATTYKIRIQPKTYAAMPAPPGAAYATQGIISAYTCTNAKAGSNTTAASATLTIDNSSPSPGAAWGTNTAGNTQVTLNWTLGTAGDSVMIVRYPVNTDTTLPVDGTTYVVGNAFGGGTIRYLGNALTFTDTGLTNGTTYYYRIFEYDGCLNYVYTAATAPWTTALTPAPPTTTIGNGTVPASSTLCPNGALTDLDAFTLATNTGTDSVTALTVTLSPTGSFNNVGTIAITNNAGTTTYWTGAPTGDATAITLTTAIPVTTTATTYKIRIQPKTYAAMPAPPGAAYATQGIISAYTCTNAKAGSNTTAASATLTIDNSSPSPGAAWGTNTAGNTQVTLNWTLGTAGDSVMIVRYTANTDTAFPADGTTYVVGNTFGTGGTIRYVGNLLTFTDTGLTNGTTYYYRIFEYDGCLNYVYTTATAPWSTALRPSAVTTTIGTGTDPASSSICPPTGTPTAIDADAFTFQTSSGTDTITAITVSLGTNAWPGISSVQITNDVGTTTYGSATPASDTVTITLTTAITATTTLTQYRVKIVPFSATSMPGVPGATYTVTARVSAFTGSFAQAGSDTAGTTITIDNASPASPTWGTNTVGNAQVALNWTNPAADFAQVVILRNTATIGDTPVEGTTTYAAGGTIGTSRIVYAGTLQTFTDTGLVNGTAYYYKAFARDACGNYSIGVQVGPLTPSGSVTVLTVGAASASVDSCIQITVTAAFTGDAPTSNSSTLFERGTAIGGPFTAICSNVTGVSPRSCVNSGLTANTTYYFRATFTDPDGVVGQNPLIVGPYTTPICAAASPTTAGTATAVVSSCNQITVTAPFTGDGNNNGSVAVEYNTTNTWPGTSACATVGGASPRMCLITGLTASTAYYVRVTYSDPDTVTGTNPQILGPLSTPACGANKVPPTIMFLAPASGAVIGSTDRAKVQVWDAGGMAATNPVQFAIDGGVVSPTGVSVNANYTCGTNCAVYEFDVATAALANGPHSITIQATDAAGNVARSSIPVIVNTNGTTANGAGNVLRRTYGSQLCVDCHALATHSSQTTSTTYGNWSVDCLTCHAPHNTPNIDLVRRQIQTPNSGTNTIDYRVDDRVGATEPQYSHLGSGTNYTDGICETCHTKTNHYRNNASGDHTHNSTTRCIGCHQHQKGFAASESVGGYSCSTCHPAIWNGMNGTVAKTTKHTLGNVVGTNDSFTDTTLGWVNPLNANAAASRSCLNMCHQDHVHNPPAGTTHNYNVHQDGSTQASRTVARDGAGNITGGTPNQTDFNNALANGGMCLSCHKNPVDAAHSAVVQTNYAASAHNYTNVGSFGAWQYILHDGSAFDRNCIKCHWDSSDGTTPTISGATAIGVVHSNANASLLMGTTNPAGTPASMICYRCHGGGTTGADYSSKPVYQEAAKVYAHPMDADTVHNSTTEFNNAAWGNTLGVTGRHANCQDCHAPHVAQKTVKQGTATAATTTTLTDSSMNGRWTASQWVGDVLYVPSLAAGQNTRSITASTAAGDLTVAAWTTAPAVGAAYYILDNTADGALAGAWGAQLSTNPTAWTAPAATNFTKQTLGAGSGVQATLCFKCHSSYYWGAGAPPPGLSPNGTALTPGETDVAMEFNPANRSGHPVLASLNNYTGNLTPKALTAAQLSAPWNVNVGAQTMSCTDCHNTDAALPAAQGPHGSAMKFMLAGANTNWPQNAAGTPYTLGNNPTNNTFLAGLFCLNCHPMFTGTTNSAANWAGNNAHYEHSGVQVGNVNCYQCHIMIPHGGKVSRLIATNTAGLPARYAYSNSGANVTVTQFMKATGPGSYTTGNCNTSCSGHGTVATPETW